MLQATRGDTHPGLPAAVPQFRPDGERDCCRCWRGVRVVHHPDPTDAPGWSRTVAGYRATLLVTTPTFLGYMLGVATPDDLRSLRIIVTGAEKCPETSSPAAPQLAPQATILEGYGITECSPVVAGNRSADQAGHGRLPVDGVRSASSIPNRKQPLPAGTTGMLLVRGPSVFRGYLDYDGPDPFVEVDGQAMVRHGRPGAGGRGGIHPFSRAAEAVPQGGRRDGLAARLGRAVRPALSAHRERAAGGRGRDRDARRAAGSCCSPPRTSRSRQANAILAEAGFRGVMRLDEVVRLDAIPVLGTGKTDYKVLRQGSPNGPKPRQETRDGRGLGGQDPATREELSAWRWESFPRNRSQEGLIRAASIEA